MKHIVKFLYAIFIIVIVVLFSECKNTSKIVRSDKDSTKVNNTSKVLQFNDVENKEKIDTIKKTGDYCEGKDTNLTKLKNGTDYVELDGITYVSSIRDSVPDILKQVFPDAYFVVTRIIKYPPSETFSMYQEGKFYSARNKFNKVYSEIGNKNSSFTDRFIAFLYFQQGLDKKIVLLEQTDTNEKVPDFNYIFNKRVNIRITETNDDGFSRTYEHTFLICFENEQFKCYIMYWENEFSTVYFFE
ncbi:MAG: hypothetical protein JXB49_01445 [Bacteroidales bacterium]|nr:hypothetical protein [Bacteroidales bacterium]